MTNDEFSTLPTGRKYKTSSFIGGVKQKLEKITRSGESKILHDKVDTIAGVLDRYATYIKRGGLSRLQRIAVARAMKNEGDLSKIEYRMVKKLVKEYARGRANDDLMMIADEEKRKRLAKESGAESAKAKRRLDFDDDETGFALGRKKQRILFAKQLVAPQTRVSAKEAGNSVISAANRNERNEPSFASDISVKRKAVREDLRRGALNAGLTNVKNLCVSALGYGREKGSAKNLGIEKPKSGFAFSQKQVGSPKNVSSGSKKPLGW